MQDSGVDELAARRPNPVRRGDTQLQPEGVCPVFAGLWVQGSLADAVKHNGSAVLRKWGELTLNPHPDATGCTKRNAGNRR